MTMAIVKEELNLSKLKENMLLKEKLLQAASEAEVDQLIKSFQTFKAEFSAMTNKLKEKNEKWAINIEENKQVIAAARTGAEKIVFAKIGGASKYETTLQLTEDVLMHCDSSSKVQDMQQNVVKMVQKHSNIEITNKRLEKDLQESKLVNDDLRASYRDSSTKIKQSRTKILLVEKELENQLIAMDEIPTVENLKHKQQEIASHRKEIESLKNIVDGYCGLSANPDKASQELKIAKEEMANLKQKVHISMKKA